MSKNTSTTTSTKKQKSITTSLNELETTISVLGEKNTENIDIKFDNDKREIYYKTMRDYCVSKKIPYRIIDTINLLLDSIINYSNKTNNTRLIRINIDKFIRITKNNKIHYEIYAFILNLKYTSTRKYVFKLEYTNNIIKINDIKIINAETPIKRFSCDESVDCTERHSSLKKKSYNKFVNSLEDTELDYSLYKQKRSNTKNALTVNRRCNIILSDKTKKPTFPCRKLQHKWDKYGIENVKEQTSSCYGLDSAINKRNIMPYYHVSMFNNLNYNEDHNMNSTFEIKSLLLRDHTVSN